MENEKEKENSLFMLTVQTNFFKKLLIDYKENCNQINKGLAQGLADVLDVIENYIPTAEVVDDPNSASHTDLILPVIENNVLQQRATFFCKACKQDVSRNCAEKLTNHFLTTKHLKNLREYARELDCGAADHSSQNEGSTQSLDGASTKQQKNGQKNRQNSLPAAIKDVVPRERFPLKMRDFMRVNNLEDFANHLLHIGQKVVEQRKHFRVCEILRQRLCVKYPMVKTFPFGSYGIGLGDEKSDLDIFVDIEDSFFQKLPKRRMKDAIYNIQRILGSVGGNEWGDFSPVSKFSVTYFYSSTNIK
jgi:predicted nucleotidyltransferase